MSTANKNAAAVATATPTDAAKAEALFNSVKAYSQALATAGANEWGGGLPLDVYQDSYKADGSLDTFATRATADKPASEQKIGGRYVINAAGQRRKLYNSFANLLTGGIDNVVNEPVTFNGETLPHMAIKEAKFGIKATDTGERREPSDEYTIIKHELLLPEAPVRGRR